LGGGLYDVLSGGLGLVGDVTRNVLGGIGELGGFLLKYGNPFRTPDREKSQYEQYVSMYGQPKRVYKGLVDNDVIKSKSGEMIQSLDIPSMSVSLSGMPGALSSYQLLERMGAAQRWIAVFEGQKTGFNGYSEDVLSVMPAGWKPYSQSPGKFTPTARAFGGSIKQYTPYLVGERGPELMIPDSSGYMLPNTGLQALQAPGDLRMAGGGATINASVTINNPVVSDAADIDKLAEKVSSAQVRTLRAAGFMRPS
jgi:hypothetical protein